MATYDNLPVYKTSYDLLCKIFQLAKNFSKEYKYTLGEKLKNEIIELIILIFKANSHYEKKPYLEQARWNIEVVRLLLRLIKDLHQVNVATFVEVNQLVESVSKQLTAWEKYSSQ